MDMLTVLREFKNIDKQIEVEVLSINMGKAYAKEFYNTLQGSGFGDKVQNAPKGDSVFRATELLSEPTRMKEQLRREEWQHLMEYRRLMQLKLFCLRGLGNLLEEDEAVVRERALENMSWAQIAAVHNYSESQVKRRFNKALERFSAEYATLSAENVRT